MKFDQFLNILPQLKLAQLGGIDAQFKLAPQFRKPYELDEIRANNPKLAAVLALFYERNNETHFLLTLRANYNGTHAAQISFPGGKLNKVDINLQAAAIRETEEEVGIDSKEINIIKKLTQVYIPPSNFLVTPFIGFLEQSPNFTKNYEVKQLIEVALSDFLNEKTITTTSVTTSNKIKLVAPCFNLNNYYVWGATAMILSEIRELLRSV